MFDVDSFKHYNDTNGHVPGDKLLRRLGELLRAATKEKGTPARFGGEEFIVLFRGPLEEAVALAEHIRSMVAEYPFEHRGKQPLGTISVSGGVASMPANGTTLEELVQAADDALYRSKRGGKNRVTVAGSPFAEITVEV